MPVVCKSNKLTLQKKKVYYLKKQIPGCFLFHLNTAFQYFAVSVLSFKTTDFFLKEPIVLGVTGFIADRHKASFRSCLFF